MGPSLVHRRAASISADGSHHRTRGSHKRIKEQLSHTIAGGSLRLAACPPRQVIPAVRRIPASSARPGAFGMRCARRRYRDDHANRAGRCDRARRPRSALRRTRSAERRLADARERPDARRLRPERRRQDDAAARACDAAASARRRACACSATRCRTTRWAVRGRIGLLGHEPLLYRELTARENLRFHAALHGVAEERVAELLGAVEIERRADEPLRTLSRGMVQRVAVARAAAARPRAAAARRAAREPRPGGRRARRAADRARVGAHARDRQPRPGRRPRRGRRRARAACADASRSSCRPATSTPEAIVELYR